MKKIVSTFLLLFAVCGASAQLHVDLRVGASASMLSEQHLKLGLRGGVNIGYLFDEHFGLRTGLCYVMKGATTSSDVFDYASDRATRLSYIDLPVEATVGFRLSPTSRFDLHAGPYLSRLLRAKVHTNGFLNKRADTISFIQEKPHNDNQKGRVAKALLFLFLKY